MIKSIGKRTFKIIGGYNFIATLKNNIILTKTIKRIK